MSDLISRQAAIDALQNLAYNDWNNGTSTSWGDAFTECAEIISGLPSAQPEQKTGKWVLKTLDDGYGEFQIYECDQCGAYTAQRRNFCYNCGAKMVANNT